MVTVDELADRMTEIEAGALEQYLAEQPALVHGRTLLGDTLLHVACKHKRADLARVLIAAGADVNARGDLARTPLHEAVHDGAAEVMVPVIGALVEAHAIVELEDNLGFTVEETLIREVWGDAHAALAALGLQVPSYEPTLEHWQSGLAIDRLLGAFAAGRALPDEVVEGADPQCIRDLRSLLGQLAATTWAEPIRTWLRTQYKPAYANRWYAIYARRDRAS